MAILVTGAAGFIGFHVCRALLRLDQLIIGIDNLNSYYEVNLKHSRLKQLKNFSNFIFHKVDISEKKEVSCIQEKYPFIDRIVHLAAQAGVRYSLKNPEAYSHSNLVGHINILELGRNLPNLQHVVYASSSSVYGTNSKLPFSVQDPVEQPISLYAATKRSGELIAYTYAHLYNMKITGLRFFTVYGPWGRPDMSAFIFTKAIFGNEEIQVFNQGQMRRNFTYIDDVVSGVLACLENVMFAKNKVTHRLYNIGNNGSELLMDFISILERTIGKKGKLKFFSMQPGDIKETIADITETTKDLGFAPKTNIEEGLKNFVEWFGEFYKLNI